MQLREFFSNQNANRWKDLIYAGVINYIYCQLKVHHVYATTGLRLPKTKKALIIHLTCINGKQINKHSMFINFVKQTVRNDQSFSNGNIR